MSLLDQYIDEFGHALTMEIEYQKKVGGRPYHIHDGRKLLCDQGGWIYLFTMEHEVSLPDGTPVRVDVGQDVETTGQVIGLDNFDLILSLERDLGEQVPEANLYSEPWQLLEALRVRLLEIKSRNAVLAMAVLKGVPVALKPRKARKTKNDEISEAVRFTLENAVTFIWGPPGTGKTETLAQITAELWARNERVLILSHSNVAVDEAVARIAAKVKSFKEGELVRYGFAQPQFIQKHRHFTSFYLAAKRQPELKRRYEQLLAEREALRQGGRSDLLAKLERELGNYRREIRAAESYVIEEAEVVGTTLSKAVVDEAVFSQRWDTVILDEASMAYIPHVAYAASLAANRIVVVGDFRQLAPIALAPGAPVDRWLRRDVFDEAGIVGAVEQREPHPCMTMLDVQHRMHPCIAGFASVRFYGGQLRDAPGMAENVAYIVDSGPFPKEPLILFDLSQLAINSVIQEDNSRFNLFSALACVTLASSAPVNTSIAIITPYVAQARLLRALISDLFPREGDPTLSRCRASTVHRFQGSQADLVILDLVDSSGRPGTLISSADESPRLINVAVTRARGKLAVVCKRSYIEGVVSQNMPTRWLLGYIKEKGLHCRILDAVNSGLLRQRAGQLEWFTDEEEAFRRLKNDLAKFTSIRGCVQGEWVTTKVGSAIFEGLAKSGSDVALWCDKPWLFKETSLENGAIMKKFVPFSALFLIDPGIVWCGVPVIEGDCHVWVRYYGKKGAATIAGLFSLDRGTVKGLRAFIEKNRKCPECGSPITVRLSRNRRGVVFLGCTNYPSCTWRNWLDPNIVEDYLSNVGLSCSKCGGRLVARRGHYGVFVGCSNFPECNGSVRITALL